MNEGYLTATEAARLLGISLPTLYSYVSRGLIRSEFADRKRRTRRYHAEDVRRLQERQELRRDPSRAPSTALHWGLPLLESALTLIAEGRLYYRGHDASELAAGASVEEVAALFWTGTLDAAPALFAEPLPPWSPRFESIKRSVAGLLPAVSPLEKMQALVPLAAAEDLAAYDLSPERVARTGARLLRLMAGLIGEAPGRSADRGQTIGSQGNTNQENKSEGVESQINKGEGSGRAASDGIAVTLQRALRPGEPEAIRPLSMALILCADHELNVSSFTARCVASAGSPPYAVVSAGLAALQGVRHGGNCMRVEALLREAERPENAATTMADRIKRGDGAPGFGHRLYPQGDPRGRLLLEQATLLRPEAPVVRLAAALAQEAERTLHDYPNLDFGLVTLCMALELPPGAALALFALGRTLGWIGHALEEYQAGRLIRPRAHYVGDPPTP